MPYVSQLYQTIVNQNFLGEAAWPHLPVSWICHVTIWVGLSSRCRVVWCWLTHDYLLPLPHCLCAHIFCVSNLKSGFLRKTKWAKSAFIGSGRGYIRVHGCVFLSFSTVIMWYLELGPGIGVFCFLFWTLRMPSSPVIPVFLRNAVCWNVLGQKYRR